MKDTQKETRKIKIQEQHQKQTKNKSRLEHERMKGHMPKPEKGWWKIRKKKCRNKNEHAQITKEKET